MKEPACDLVLIVRVAGSDMTVWRCRTHERSFFARDTAPACCPEHARLWGPLFVRPAE